MKKLGLDDAIRESRDIYSLIETLDQVDQIIRELPNLIHHWKTIDQQQPMVVKEDQRAYDEIQKFLEDVKTESYQHKSGEQKHLDDLRTNLGFNDENISELTAIRQSNESEKLREYFTSGDRKQKTQQYIEKFRKGLFPDLKDLRTDEKLRKDLEEQIQILRTNSYSRKNKNKIYSEKENFFRETTKKVAYHTDLFHLIREELPNQLRKGKTIDDIEKLYQCNLKELPNELHIKMMSIPKYLRDEYFSNHFFPTVNKTGPHWSDILRVTECEHCNYRWVFPFLF